MKKIKDDPEFRRGYPFLTWKKIFETQKFLRFWASSFYYSHKIKIYTVNFFLYN